MPFTRAGQLARQTPVALLDSPLGLVAENLRESKTGAIPVVDRLPPDFENDPRPALARPRVLGLIDERDLSAAILPALENVEARRFAKVGTYEHNGAPPLPEALSNGAHPAFNNGHAAANGYARSNAPVEVAEMKAVSEKTAREIMRPDCGHIPASFSLHNALLALERYDVAALPVMDESGAYRGMVSRADLVAAIGGQARPPVVGGMATPLGVWLTTGTVSGGAPPLGLFLSGALLGALMLVVQFVLTVGLNAIRPEWGAMFYSGRLGAASESGSIFNLLVTAAHLFAFLIGMRLLPLAGVHAAEHQTVHAIERGLPLTPEIVKSMPRAHPRCGTNLVILAGLIQIVFQHLPSLDGGPVLAALLFIFFAWRSFGTFAQVFFTTRPASQKQLESGIKAGREVLEKYQNQPHQMASFPARLLNSGIVFSALGVVLVITVGGQLFDYLARLVLKIG